MRGADRTALIYVMRWLIIDIGNKTAESPPAVEGIVHSFCIAVESRDLKGDIRAFYSIELIVGS
jgi:hypothetical protein